MDVEACEALLGSMTDAPGGQCRVCVEETNLSLLRAHGRDKERKTLHTLTDVTKGPKSLQADNVKVV